MTTRVRQAVLAAAALSALAAAVAWTPRPNATAARAPEDRSGSAPDVPLAVARESAPPPPLSGVRNVFEFADRAPAPSRVVPLAPIEVPPPLDAESAVPPAIDPLRLVGFVRRGGALRAALSLHGNVAVLAAGEQADGYSVLSVDEDSGVVLRAPDGSERLLPPPQP